MADPGSRVSYQQKYVRCGKPGCRRCADGPGHGPYWYAAWREGDRVRSRYIGKSLPPGVAPDPEKATENETPGAMREPPAIGGNAGREDAAAATREGGDRENAILPSAHRGSDRESPGAADGRSVGRSATLAAPGNGEGVSGPLGASGNGEGLGGALAAPGDGRGRAGTPAAQGPEAARAAQRDRISGNGHAVTAAPLLRIWTLGQFRVESAGLPVPDRAWRRQSATVLKLLLLADFRRLPREHIASYLWPDAGEETARNQLASAVHALRRALEPGLAAGTQSRYIRQEGANLVLCLGPHDTVDYLSFEQLLAEASGAIDPLHCLEQAAALYGGDLMPEESSAWCVAAREALRLRWHSVLLALAEAQAAHRKFAAAEATLARLLTTDPTNEEAARRLMGLLGREGRRAEALRLYARLEEALQEDLDAAPSSETQAIAQALRAGGAPPIRRRTRPSDLPRIEPAEARPGSSALIGRTSEMARLRAALQGARDGQGQAVLLAGTAGIGKTRLVEEVSITATTLGFTVLCGRAAESEQDLPYAPIAEALRIYVHSRPPGALRRDLAGAEAVRELVPELAGMLPGLSDPPPLENVGAARLRLWMAVRTLLAAAAAGRPMLLELEDLHWADEASIGLLSFLVRRTRDQRLMLLSTVRDDDLAKDHPVHDLIREGQREGTLEVTQVPGLSLDEVETLAGGRLGAAHVAILHAQCGGNPLFINELLALLQDSHQETDPGTMLTAMFTGSRALPGTIWQTLSRRLSRRSAQCRALLQAGAVIGDRFPIDLLRDVAGLEAESFDTAFDEAVTAGLLQQDDLGDERECALPHALLRRVLYEQVQPTQRQRLHARIGAELAGRTSDDRGPKAVVVAHHYAQSDDRPAAVRWLELAGDHAAGIYANASALVDYGKALDLLETGGVLSRDAGSGGAAARLNEKLGDLRLLDGDYAAAHEHFARARAAVDDRARQAELWHKEGITWERRGDFAQALAAFAAAEGAAGGDSALPVGRVDLAGHAGPEIRPGAVGAGLSGRQQPEVSTAGSQLRQGAPALSAVMRAELALSRGDVYWSRGDFEAAEKAAGLALAALEGEPEESAPAPAERRDGVPEPEGLALARAAHLLGRVAELRGDYGRAGARYRESLAIRERIGDQQGIAACWYGLGMVAYDRGDLMEAEACHRRGLAIREHIGDQWGIAFSWGKLAELAQHQGDYALAEDCNRRSLTLREHIGSRPGIAGAAYQLGQVASDSGDYAGAASYIERSLRIQEHIGDQWGCSNSLSRLGDVARERGDFAMAEQYCRRSLEIKERLGDQLGIAVCLNLLGLLAGEQGDHRTAQSLGRQARRLARRIGARGMEASASLGMATAALLAGRLQFAALLIRYTRALAAEYGSARTLVQVTLAECSLYREQLRLPEAIAVAQDAMRLAVRGQFRREEALAQRMLGSCKLAAGDPAAAMPLLRSASTLLEQIGAMAELRRTRLMLAAGP